MVRAGEGGYLAEEFVAKRCVAVGFAGMGNLSALTTLDAMKAEVRRVYTDKTPTQVASAAGVANKFRSTIRIGDHVVTYDPESRLYHVGVVASDYEFAPGYVTDYDHLRRIDWTLKVSRDVLRPESRNSLGSTLTIFEPGDDVYRDLVKAGSTSPSEIAESSADAEVRDDARIIYEDQLSRAHEFIKDRISRLEPREMEMLAAALLRSLGFRARVTPVGPDRGRDVVASLDGLGLQPPRILCEVKHRKGQMGSQDIRSFAAGLRSDDRGLYVSTGGFSKDAKYEAERAALPITLLDLDELAKLVVEHYENFDTPGRALLPLDRFYWPVP
jgi:restriction system protein